MQLGELVKVMGGGTPARANVEYYGGEIPWVTPKDMKLWDIGDSQVRITEAGLKNSAARLVPANSILIVVRSGVLKHTIPIAVNRRPVALNQDMKALVCSGDVYPDFLAHAIKARSAEILSWVRATTADNFPIEKLKRLRLSIPSFAEQRRIAAVLDHADALRAKRRYALNRLDGLVGSVFVDMFGDMGKAASWPCEKLGRLARVIRGASPRPKGDPRYFGGEIPWLMISDLTRCEGRIVHEVRQTVTDAGMRKSVYLPAGTLVLTNSATVGLPKFLGVAACIHDGFLAFLDVDSRVNAQYLYGFFERMRDRISGLAPEGTQKNLNTGIVKAVDVPVPPLELQHKFVRRVEAIERLKEKQRAHLAELDALFASLRHRAFRGEL